MTVDGPTPSPPTEVVDASVPADWVRVGEPTAVRVTVRNPGDRRPAEFVVSHDGTTVATHAVTLRANATAVHDLRVVFPESRRGPVAVAGVPAGELTVAPPSEPTPSGWVGTTGDGGTGPAVALVALLAATAALLLANRVGEP